MEKKDHKTHHNHRADAKAPGHTPTVIASPIEKGKLKIVPIGGLGDKIGKNMMAIEYEDEILIIDCGFMFPGDELPGVDYVIPDISYLRNKKHRVKGILITHGHEDHIGGLPFILPELNVPIYGTRFTNALIENKLEEHGLAKTTKFVTVDPDKNEKLVFGQMTAEFIRMAHSIPDCNGVLIETPVGNIFNTGDFKIDHTPVFEKFKTNMNRLKLEGEKGLLLLMSDSTNAENPGRQVSERIIEESLLQAFKSATGRIIIASFSSQISRTQQLFDAAKATGRKVALSGRSMLKYIEISVKQGLLKIPIGTVIKIADAGKYKDNEIVILSTGAQGEDLAQLMRMATGSHRFVRLKNGDLVILSASIIPGNESSVFKMIDNLFREGAEVLREGHRGLSDLGQVHVSGHANQEELQEIIEVMKPRYFMPIHGELHHLKAHANIAKRAGYLDKDIIVVENGQEVTFTKNGFALGKKHAIEWIMVDGLGVGDVQKVVIRERQTMSEEGVFVVIVTVSKKTGELLTSPDIISRGFVYMKESEELVNKARNEIRRIVKPKAGSTPNWQNIKSKLREEVGDFLYHNTKRRPIVLPVVIEV